MKNENAVAKQTGCCREGLSAGRSVSNSIQGGDFRALRTEKSGRTLLGDDNVMQFPPHLPCRASSPKRKYLFTTPLPRFAVLSPQGGQNKWHCALSTSRGEEKTYGFTLIELLVVVLIIGILAAVALPQYQKAVLKSRYVPLKSIVKSIVTAEKAYHLANGECTYKTEELDIELPAGWQRDATDPAKYRYEDGKQFYIGVNKENDICFVEGKIDGMMYHTDVIDTNAPLCIAYTLNKNDPRARLCSQETGKENPTQEKETYLAWSY